MKRRWVLATIGLLTLAVESAASTLALRRDPRMTGPVPVPSAERDLSTAVAEKWFSVIEQNSPLEGAAFDHDGNLVFCDVGASRVLRLSADKKLSVLLHQPGLHAGGLAVHADGRIFAAGTGDSQRGALGIIDTAGHTFREVARTSTPYVPNDLVFDRHGGFYFTDFKGSALDPLGGVYYVAPDMRTVTTIARNLALANGIALSPDGAT